MIKVRYSLRFYPATIFLSLCKTWKRMPEVSRRKKLARSYLVLAPKLVDRPSRDQSRGEGREELVGSAARPVQLTIKKSPRTLIHEEARRKGGRGGREREAQLTNRPISRDDEVLRLIPSSQKPLRDSIRSRRNIEPPSQLRGFAVLGKSTEVFRAIVLKNHSVD